MPSLCCYGNNDDNQTDFFKTFVQCIENSEVACPTEP